LESVASLGTLPLICLRDVEIGDGRISRAVTPLTIVDVVGSV
jgi:hypothetical protein